MNTRDDRPLSESEEEERDSRHRPPLEDVWQLGRTLNQIQHELQVLWLIGGKGGFNSETGRFYGCDNIPWGKLRRLSRRLFDNEIERETLAKQIQVIRETWDYRIDSEERAETLFDQNMLLHEELPEGNRPDESVVFDHTKSALGYVNLVAQELERLHQEPLSKIEVSVLRLAKHLDQLVHPVPAYEKMSLPVQSGENRNPQDDSSALRWRSIAPTPPRKLIPPWQFPDLPLQRTQIVQNSEWEQDLVMRITELGIVHFDVIEILRSRQNPAPGDVLEEIEHSLLKSISTLDADQAENTALTSHVHGELNEWQETSVGLSFHLRRYIIRNVDSNEETDSLSRLHFNALRLIAQNGQSFTSRNELEEQWQRWGGRTTGEKAVDPCLSDIRKYVLPRLQMKLENKRSCGWCLTRLDE